MPEVAYHQVVFPTGSVEPAGCVIMEWTGLNTTTWGTPVCAPNYPEKCVQVGGTGGVGGSVKIEGGNHPLSLTTTLGFGALHDPGGVALTFTLADVSQSSVRQVLENTYVIRPTVVAGDADTAITVRVMLYAAARRG